LVEFAIVAPVLVVMILGTVDVADAYNAYIAVTDACREGARLAARGNIFPNPLVLQVIVQHSPNIDFMSHSTILLTEVESDVDSFTIGPVRVIHDALGETTRIDHDVLHTLHQQLTASEPDYLRVEEFVVLEIFYEHTMITGFIRATVPLYARTIMPVSAPS
jgi:hypothetical protein